VLQPYQMVKDLRTGLSTSNTGGVLDGDIDQFMEAALAQKAFGGEPAEVEDME
jgi:peptide chain release factor 2